jgi:hypothetical protein
MKKHLLTLAGLFFALAGTAQIDSSHLDIGGFVLDKNLTQTVTIKGADLEKMPFVNLSDAIAAWFYGAYSQPGRFAYVVDGNPVTDVNIYPIFDIEEVTLVEQAAGAAAYGSTQQELVVITTKRGKEGRGLRVTGQAGPVNENGNGYNTYTRVYHQYYLGAYKNEEKLSYGVSADWVRDVAPEHNNGETRVEVPFQLQRWRFNGWLEWRPAKGQSVELRMSYAPQVVKGMLDSTYGSEQTSLRLQANAHLIVPQLRWRAALLPGLTNELRAVYLQMSSNYSYTAEDNYSNGGQNISVGVLSVTSSKQLFVRDRLAYAITAGEWLFAPAVNFAYHHIDEQDANGSSSVFTDSSGQPMIYPPVLGPTVEQKGNLFYVTPGVELGWHKAVDVQIGERVNASSNVGAVSERGFPYASVGADVLRFGRKTGGSSLKVFGSYAKRSMEMVDDYSLLDYSGGGGAYSLSDVYHSPEVPAFFSTGPGNPNDTFLVRVTTPASYWTWEAGVTWSMMGGRLAIQYNAEKRLFSSPGQTGNIGPTADSSLIVLTSWTSVQHHVDVRWKAVERRGLHWLMGFNLTLLKNKSYDVPLPHNYYGSVYYWFESAIPHGDMPEGHWSYTGALVNRWQLGGFMAGLDIMYHIGESQEVFNGYLPQYNGPRLNSFLVPNVYAGYRWKTVEFFLESRGLARSQHSDLLDDRRYYVLGGSLTL